MTYSLIFVTLLVASSSARSLYDDQYILDTDPNFEDVYNADSVYNDHHRARRQLGSVYVKSDKTSGVNIKLPVLADNKNVLSAIGAVDVNKDLSSATGGLAYDNIKGHGASLTGTHIPGFGNQLTGAGHVNLLHNQNHDVTANAFLTRNMPSISQVPNFNTVGGSVDYMYKNKIGASLGAAHTPLFQRTDYSANTNLNIFRNPSTSLDFNAGVRKSVSPFMTSSWEPNAGLTLRKFF